MKTWEQVSKGYRKYLKDRIKTPQVRLSALNEIEHYLREQYSSILNGSTQFSDIDKSELRDKYQKWKGKILNGAEKQVFNDFYRLSSLP